MDDNGFWDSEYCDNLFEELHERYAPVAEKLTWEMRGFYLKQAQFLSVRDDFVPGAYLKWMKDTQDACPTELLPGNFSFFFGIVMTL